MEHPAVKPHLPADIVPRPEPTGPWEYEFALAHGAVLWVKPGRQKQTFRWGVRRSKKCAEQEATLDGKFERSDGPNASRSASAREESR